MKLYIYYISLSVVTIVIFSSCKYRKNYDADNTCITDTLYTKTITFPNSLFKLNGTQFQQIDSFLHEIEDKHKVISIIDGNCGLCVDGLNKMDSIFNSIIHNNEAMIFILNVSSDDSALFMNYLHPMIRATGAVLWDNNYNFERQNKLFTADPNLRTFMLNNDGKIIQFGNPLINRDVIFEYQEKFESEYFKD